jgi:hypothetical protein
VGGAPRPLLVVGLSLTASSLLWLSFMTSHSGYGFVLPAFVLMGLGMGLTMSPMTTAAMNSVDRTKAGVASGILSMARMVGGTFGVAVLGAIVAGVGGAKLDERLPHVAAATRGQLTDSLGAGGVSHGSAQVVATTHDAFISALGTGLKLGAAVAYAGALIAWTLVSGGRPEAPAPVGAAAPEAIAEPVAA